MGNNKLRFAVKVPWPVPALAKLFAMVGFGVVLQQIPLLVPVAPPLFVILPPQMAVVDSIDDAEVVVRVGNEIVVKETSLPYPVPAEFVAKALI